MKGSLRHLWAMLSFVVPLALLGWWAASELAQRSQQVTEQAGQTVATALDGPTDALGRWLDRSFTAIAPTALNLEDQGPGQAAASIAGEWPALRHLVLLDGDGALVHPNLAPSPHLPLSRPPLVRPLVAAEAALAMDRPAQAEGYLRRFLRDHEVTSPMELQSEVRGRYWLATLLRRRGADRPALQTYREVLDWVALAEASPGPAPEIDTLHLRLLATTAIAELEDSPGFAAAALEEIATGQRDRLDEAVLQSVWARLEQRLTTWPEEALPTGQLAIARALEGIRRAGRGFATRYGADLAAAARRHMRSAQGTGRWLEVVPGAEPGLIMLRPASPAERAATGAAWVGAHVDAVLSLADSLAPFLSAPDSATSAAGIGLAVVDRDGLGFLPGAMPPADASQSLAGSPGAPLVAERSLTVPGLRLLAAVDQESWLDRAQAQNRTEALLVLGMFLAAVLGALWLWRSVSRAEELAALKVELMSRLSHELKTPLALVKMYAETLALDRARDSEERKRFGGIITREADRLSLLLERVLNFSRRRAGLLIYRKEPCDLSDLITRTLDAWQPHAKRFGATLTADIQPAVQRELDPAAFGSALLNLLDNAVKFTPDERRQEPIHVELRRGAQGDVLEVRDRGIGIPPADRKRVFRGFNRGRNASHVAGAGLGLEMVAHCCRAHGATVDALPREGGGTTVRIHWPAPVGDRDVPESPPAAAQPDPDPESP